MTDNRRASCPTPRGRRRLTGAVAALALAGVLAGGATLEASAAGGSGPSHADRAVASVASKARRALDATVARQAAAATSAFDARRATTATLAAFTPGAVTSAHSLPVADRGGLVAVAAYFYSATGRTIQVLSYAAGRWRVAASLRPALGAPVQPRGDRDLLALADRAVPAADVTGDGRPDFLVALSAATNMPGVVVSQDGAGGGWRLVPARGPFPSSDVVARTPRFEGRRLVSTYDDCVPDCASGHRSSLVWTYERSIKSFWAPNPPGDSRSNPTPPGAGASS
jgi:hypothetical protein